MTPADATPQTASPKMKDGPFMVIRASAGSGKTFRLVQEFLTCCLRASREDGVRQILAITFTKKAAQEMRTRIVEYVAEVAAGQGPMFDKLLETGEWKPEELQRSADALRSHMLHHYEDFSVMTIDSFVSRLVRVFARDLRLEDNFDVELSLDVMVEGTVDRLLARVGTGPDADPDVTALLQEFARNQVEDDSDLNLRGQLVKLAKLLAQERIEADLGQIHSNLWTPLRFRELQARLRRERQSSEREIAGAAQELLGAIESANLSEAFTKRGSVPGWLRNFARRPGFKNAATDTVRRQFESEKFTVQNPRPEHRAGIETLLPQLRAFWERYAAYYLDEAGGRNRLKEALSRRVGLVGTMAMLRQEMEALQMEENVRLLQSLNAQIAAVIRENPAPYIYERLGTRYRYLFIDEFQDTSVTQWHNLVPLYHEALASDPRNRTLVVGDAKQAIYRWRNGDYEQLQRLPGLIGTDLPPALLQAQEAFDAQLGTDHLEVNRRSLPAIIAWNNTFFGALRPLLPAQLRGVYDDLEQKAWRPGWGTVRVTSRTAKRKEDRDAARNRWLVECIAAHGGGEVVYDEQGGVVRVNWKEGGRPLNEIAILVRKNKEGANIAQFLLSVHISPFTEESLLLGRHPLPLAVVALMRSILDPEHPGHALAFVQCYCALFPVWDEAQLLFAHSVTRERKRADGKTIYERGVDWKGLLREVCPEMDLARFQIEPLVVLMGHLLEKLDGLRRYAPYAEALLEAANQLKGRGKGGVPGFLKAWDQRLAKSSIRARAAADSVQIMTVHKSKGLAFPVVLLPMGFEKNRSFKSEITVRLDEDTYGLPAGIFQAGDLKASAEEQAFLDEYERTLLDAVNVAYVGMTRPRDVLELFFDWEPKSQRENERAAELPSVSNLWDQAFERAFGVGLWPEGEGEERVFHAGPEGGLEPLREGVLRAEGAPEEVQRPESEEEPEPESGSGHVVQLEGMRVGLPVRQLAVAPEGLRWTPEGGRLSARERGKWVHRLLAQLPDRRAWEDVRAEWQASHAMPAADKVDLLETVDRILSLMPVAPFFEPGAEVHAERPFADDAGQIFIPDRLLRTPTGWSVLDFKTGKPRPEHPQQVARYMRQLTAIEPGAISGWLCYVETGDCVAVAPELF